MKVMYLHGLEGSANGTKGLYCQQQFDASAPQMPAFRDKIDLQVLTPDLISKPTCFEECYQIALNAVQEDQPDLIIGSSFGGGISTALMQRGEYIGRVILLAPASVRYQFDDQIPPGNTVIIIHATEDQLIPFEDSMLLTRHNPDKVQLWPCLGDHGLHTIIGNGLLKRAVEYMRVCAVIQS